MQPYFFPYIGYYQLINAVDLFVIYDNIKYTKKGWINRNRILKGDGDTFISLPIKRDSDYKYIYQRRLADEFNKKKMLNKIKGAYIKAPYFKQTFPVIEQIINLDTIGLFTFLCNSLTKVCAHLDINTPIIKSSSININHALKAQDKVLAICEETGANTYINAIGGISLYSNKQFFEHKIDLRFIKSKAFEYPQFKNKFCPWLSIIDVMMFNSIDSIKENLNTGYDLVKAENE
jgi:hypothetical protein